MSLESPTKKGKRARTSSENSISFVKQVTSRVSSLLPPKFTNWFHNKSSRTGNGSPPTTEITYSLPTADGSDSSDDDTADRTVISLAAKRMRFSSSSLYHHYGSSEAGCSGTDVEIIDRHYSPFAGPQYGQTPSRNTFTTSMQPPNDEPESLDRDSSQVFKLPNTVSSIGQSVAGKRKSIFDTTSPEESVRKVAKSATNTMRDPKQPNFKPSLLGSPFYPGRTMYGGAASSTYINQPNINRQTEAVANEPKSIDDTAISGSARRIVDLFESFTSPLMEARRIPLFKKPNNDGFHNSSSDRFSPYNKKPTHKTRELLVPRIAELLCFKKKSRLMETSNVARQLIASHSSASDFPSYPAESKGKEPEMEQAQKITTKVKTRVTRNNRGTVDLHEMATPVKLPSVPLPLDNNLLPQLSFTTAVVSTPATAPPKIVLPTASKHETVTNSDFIFSHPVKVSNEMTQACSTTPKFTFDSPEHRIDQKFESKCDDCFVVVGVVQKPESCSNKTKESEYSSCTNCWDKTKARASKCICCGSKKSVQNVKCSVCKLVDSQYQKDKCANCEKMSVSQVVSTLMPKSTGVGLSSKWKCEDCWVSNDESAAKCACCGSSRPKRVSSEASTAAATTSTSTLQADSAICKPVPVKAVPATPNVDADWKCDDCWISNKSSVDKCAACGGARPGGKQTGATNVPTNTKSFFGSSDDKFKNIKSQKTEKWECCTCLVRNESEQDKCVCCGGEKENKKKISGPKFNFGKINNSFKFGIDPKVQEATIAEKPEIISTLDSKLKTQSETNKNVLAVSPTFTFNLPKKSIENESDASKTNSEETPKLNIPKPISTNTVVTNKETNKEEEEKLQEVPSVDLNAPVQSNPPVVSLLTQTNNETSRTLHNALKDDGKKNTSLNSVDVAVPLSEEKPKPTFSFGLSPSTKMFEPPASTGTSMNLFTQPAQSATPTTIATTLSMFKPPENSASSASLFQKPDLTPKPAPLFPNSESTNNTAAVPMFGFRNNTPSNPPAVLLTLPAASEKPKFQFTFGNNPTPSIDPPSLFKSPFGAAKSSNALANTFNFSAGTALGSNNTLATNSLGGSNALTAANGITGNAMADGSLGSIAGNSISSQIGNGGTLGGTNGLSANPLPGTSSMQPGNILTGATPSMFNNTVQKENVWASSTHNLFSVNSTSSSLQKPPTFTFGSSITFNANTAFGSRMPSQNVFNMNTPPPTNNTQPPLFTNTGQSQPTENLFGSAPSSEPMFGTRNMSSPGSFGSPNTSIPEFDEPSHTPPPSFNFSGPQSTGIYGFGQQQLQQQQMQQHLQPQQLQHQASTGQSGVYSFGGAPAGAPQIQFSMGSGANPAVRRVRKAVRRNPQR